MAKMMKSGINLVQEQILNGTFETVASDPVANLFDGWVIYNTTDNAFKYYDLDNTTWVAFLSFNNVSTDGTFASPDNNTVATTQAIATYVNNLIDGRIIHGARVSNVDGANVNLANELENGDTLDGVVLATGDRVLLRSQTDATENGVYLVAASGAASRDPEFDTGPELANQAFLIEEGTTTENRLFIVTTDSITIGVTAITITEFGGAVPDASTTQKGIIEIATQAEVDAGVDTTRAVTPATLAGSPFNAGAYTQDFTSSAGQTITAATHGLAASKALGVFFYEDGSPNETVEVDYFVADNGDVTWSVPPGKAFTGHLVIVGFGS